MLNMINAYKKYLEIIGAHLTKFFEQQKPYIFCKEGCSICCETGNYPFSKIEFDYLMLGFEQLPYDVKSQIRENIKRIQKERKKSGDDRFLHVCPFLINNKCSVYLNRALICRSYGLTSFYNDKDGVQRYRMPCCVSQGLNYSNVYDKDAGTFTTEKWKESGIEAEPISYNVSLTFLLNNKITEHLGLDFGEQKPLMGWFD